MNLKINRQIRAPKVRLIDASGQQVGLIGTREALDMARDSGLDLVEISPNSEPPVCKIMDYGKFCYDQTKREKENKKTQLQIKIKEVKLKPNIDENDFNTKAKQARLFVEKGNKVKITCTFRGRELAYPHLGQKVIDRMQGLLLDIAKVESEAKLFGRSLICVLVPADTVKIKIKQEKSACQK